MCSCYDTGPGKQEKGEQCPSVGCKEWGRLAVGGAVDEGPVSPLCWHYWSTLSAVLQGNVNSWHCWDLLGRAFLIHPASSGFGSCVNSLLLTKACLSCTVRKESVRSWVRGRDEDEMWAARVDFWCTFDKCTFKSNQQWTQVLNSDPQPGLQVICISFGILQSLAKCHGSTSFLAASAKYIP